MNKTKLGGAFSAGGAALFALPTTLLVGVAALAADGIKTIPPWVITFCLIVMVAGALMGAIGHFLTALYASATDAQQQVQLNSLKNDVQSNTKIIEQFTTGPITAKVTSTTPPPANPS